MRAVYLVRHGQPDTPPGSRLCVGRMDLPLSETGRAQARRLGEYFAGLPVEVISSPLVRCRDTAREISGGFETEAGLLELDMGEWTGLSFDVIRARWPELYEKRGREPDTAAPPRGESLEQCAQRAVGTFWRILETHPGNTVVLSTHSGVIRALCARLTGRPASELTPPPCGSVTQLLVSGETVYPGPYGVMPKDLPTPVPDAEACEVLMDEFGTPEHVRAHCRAVSELAGEMCRTLNARGESLSGELIRAAALLHDVARTEARHEEYAARALCEKGLAAVGAAVGNHMSLGGESPERWSESAVVFLADKLIRGDEMVSLEERFFAAPDPRKLPYIRQRYELARTLLRRLGEETNG